MSLELHRQAEDAGEVSYCPELGAQRPSRLESKMAILGRHENWFYVALLSALVLGAWIPVLRTSFTLDETGTFWAISGGAQGITARATHFPQSILYCFMAWAIETWSGASEVALRLPSVIAGIICFWLLYRVGARLLDKTAGLIAALIWALLPVITAEATLARPYMFGMLAVLGSFLALLRWLESPTLSRWIIWLVLAAIPTYFSYFFGLALLHQSLYASFRCVRRRKIPLWQLFCATPVVVLLDLPLAPSFLSASSERAIHTYLARPGPTALVNELIPHAFAYALTGAICLHLLLPLTLRYRRYSSECLLVAAGWAAIPMAILFALSWLTATPVFTPRYLMAASPGLALYLAFLLRGFEPPSVRIIATGIMAVFAATGFGPEVGFWSPRRYGDYRSASRYVSNLREENNLPLYAFSAFIEGKYVRFPVSEDDRTSLLAPLIAYPVGRSVTLLPSALHPGSRDFINRFVGDLRRNNRSFLLYAGNPGELPDWFTQQVVPAFREQWIYNKEDVGIAEYSPR